jgi:hypothetical protein
MVFAGGFNRRIYEPYKNAAQARTADYKLLPARGY